MRYKIGDIVLYRNTRGNIKRAEITSFKIVENGNTWFNGIDTVSKAKVWYPVHISEKLVEHQFKIGDHIDYLIGKEWQHDYATIYGFDKNSNLPIAETNRPAHDGCKWSYTFDLSKIRLTQHR
ncbi:hypothetical protein [Parabacteroides provencensis]|uniref:hypothetical protein n=1 Tax=Parabacteroides provencensis TaxID=1944636 RepID=UPI000C161550|nr:hypothetical protein [Parabacteroides provencensis]